MTWWLPIETKTASLVLTGVALAVVGAWSATEYLDADEAMSSAIASSIPVTQLRSVDDADLGDVERGRAYYAQLCVSCHGARGDGLGEWAYRITPKPANLTGARVAARGDAELYRIITDGIPGTAMMGWRRQLSDVQRHQVVAYVRHLGLNRRPRHE